LESNDAVESAELVVGDYSEVDWKLVDKIFVELESDFWHWYTNSTIKNSGLEKQNQF
jgi:hypothetical protein